MDICDIVVYMALGLLGMVLIFISIVILAYGQMKDEEKMMRKLMEMESET